MREKLREESISSSSQILSSKSVVSLITTSPSTTTRSTTNLLSFTPTTLPFTMQILQICALVPHPLFSPPSLPSPSLLPLLSLPHPRPLHTTRLAPFPLPSPPSPFLPFPFQPSHLPSPRAPTPRAHRPPETTQPSPPPFIAATLKLGLKNYGSETLVFRSSTVQVPSSDCTTGSRCCRLCLSFIFLKIRTRIPQIINRHLTSSLLLLFVLIQKRNRRKGVIIVDGFKENGGERGEVGGEFFPNLAACGDWRMEKGLVVVAVSKKGEVEEVGVDVDVDVDVAASFSFFTLSFSFLRKQKSMTREVIFL